MLIRTRLADAAIAALGCLAIASFAIADSALAQAPARQPVTELPLNVPAPVAPEPHVSVAYGSDGRILTAWNGTARLWSAEGEAERAWGCEAKVQSAWFTPDADRVIARHGAVGGNGTGTDGPGTASFDADNGKVIHRWPGLEPATGIDGQLLISRDGKLMLGRSGDTFRLMYNARGGQGPAMSHPEATHVALSPDGRYVLTGGADGAVILWEAAHARKRQERRHDGPVNVLAFSHDGAHALSGAGDHSTVWAVPGGEESFSGGQARISQADALTAELRGASMVLRSVPDGTEVCTWRHKLRAVNFGFSHSGTKVFVQGPTRSEIWNVPGCEFSKKRNTTMMRPRIGSYTMSPDGAQLLMAGHGMASLWVFPTRKRPTVMFHDWPTPKQGAYSVAFSPKGDRLVTPESDNTARIVSLPDGAVLATMAHTGDTGHCGKHTPF